MSYSLHVRKGKNNQGVRWPSFAMLVLSIHTRDLYSWEALPFSGVFGVSYGLDFIDFVLSPSLRDSRGHHVSSSRWLLHDSAPATQARKRYVSPFLSIQIGVSFVDIRRTDEL